MSISIDTNSFYIKLDDNYVLQEIKMIDPELEGFFKEKPEAQTSSLIAELAMNLHVAKSLANDYLTKIDELEEKMLRYQSENEMLRDEVEGYNG